MKLILQKEKIVDSVLLMALFWVAVFIMFVLFVSAIPFLAIIFAH